MRTGVRGVAGRTGGPPRRAATAIAAAVAVLTLLGPAALARPAELTDPRDTRGPLDIRRVELRGTKEAHFKVTTGTRWTARRMQDRGFFLIHLDTFGTPRFDHFALVRSDGRRVQGSLWRSRRGHDARRLRGIPGRHSGARTATVVVPLRAVTLRRSHFRWRAQTLWGGWPCDRTCFDRAPRRGGVLRPLGRP